MSRWPITWYNDAAESADRRWGWDKLPLPIAMLVLIGLRNVLREKNLVDTGRGPLDKPDISDHPNYLTARTLDGTFNNLDDPLMGALNSRFGRNVPLEFTVREKDPMTPNPRTISRELLTRKEFIPATTLNLLAGAWIQFEVHDWFSHGQNEADNPWKVPLADDDPWPQHPMEIQRTRRDPSADPDGPPTFVTGDTHWWDASQIYGNDPAFAAGDPHRRGRQAEARRPRADPGGRGGARQPHRCGGQLLGRARAAALAVHARAQRRLRPPARHASGAVRRAAVRQGAARRRSVDGEDPHRRLDAGDHRAPDHGEGAAHELVGARGRDAGQEDRPHHVERGDPRHPRLADRAARRPVPADRGVRRRLPHAPADPGRLQLPLARGRPRAAGADAAGSRGAAGARPADRDVDGGRLLLVRHDASRARSRCTTSRSSCRTSTGPTASTSTSRRSTSCACASAACRGTTSSAGCCT